MSGVEERDPHDGRRVEGQIGAGTDPQRTGQSAGHIREEIAVLVQYQHDLKLLGHHDDLAQERVEELDKVRHFGKLARNLDGDLFKQTVGGLLNRVFGGARDALAGFAGEVECIARRFAHRPALDDAQADRAILADHSAGIIVGPAGGDPHDVQIKLAAKIRRHAGYRIDRTVNDGKLEPPPQDRIRALLGGCRGMFERDPCGGDHLYRLVVYLLAAQPAIFEPKIDLHEVEPDRQSVGELMDGLRELGANPVAQELRHLVGGTR